MKKSLIICFIIGLSLNIFNNAQGESLDLNIAGWKTYTNKNYGYQIDYPQEWDQFEWRGRGGMEICLRDPSKNRQHLRRSVDVFISIDNNLNRLSLNSWAEEMKPLFGEENQVSIYKRITEIGGKEGLVLVEKAHGSRIEGDGKEVGEKPPQTINGAPPELKEYFHFLVKRDIFIYRISAKNTRDMAGIYIRMLKSFDFTELAIVLPGRAKDIIEAKAWKTLNVIKVKKFAQLANVVHPVKGISFSYEGTLHAGNVKASELPTIMSNEEKRFHGTWDGSGEDWSFNFKEYYKRFIYDRDFTGAEKIGYNQIIGWGCTVKDNLADYPGCIVVEYYIPYTEKHGTWRSLRLVFEELKGTWFLVRIIHDEWTI